MLTALLPAIGFSRTSAIVAGVAELGLLVTVTLLPEPKGISLEELTEPAQATRAWRQRIRVRHRDPRLSRRRRG